jgi:hypothetical protein
VASAAINVAVDLAGAKGAVSALTMGVEAGIFAARGWSPSLVRELGVTAANVVQRRYDARAAGLLASGSPGLFGSHGVIPVWLRQSLYSGEFNPVDILPGAASLRSMWHVKDACFN